MIIPELPAYLTSLGGGEYKGLIISLFTLTAAISRPFSGKLADTIGRIPVMVIGASVCFVIGFLYPVIGSAFGFFVLRFLHGFSTGFKPTGTSAYIADVVPFNRRGEALGIMGVFGSLGIAAGPALGGHLAAIFSLDAMFYTSSFLAILSVLILLGMTETVAVKHPFTWQLLKIPLNEVIEKRVLGPSVVMFLTAYSFGVVLTIIPDFSDHLGISNRGYFFAYFTAASILVRVIAGKLSDKYGRIVILKVSTMSIMIAMYLIGNATSIFDFFASGGFLGFAAGMNTPTIFAWTIDLSDPMHRGRAMSTMFIAMEIGIGIGALMTGWLYGNTFQNIAITFHVAAVLAGIAFVYILLFCRKTSVKLL